MNETGLSPRQVREEITVPLLLEMIEHWKLVPSPAASLATVAAFVGGWAGRGRPRAPVSSQREPAENFISAMMGMKGVGFSETPLPPPLDPAGLHRRN